MDELVKVHKAGKVVDSRTFTPELQVVISLNLEALTDTSVLYSDAYIEREFVKELVKQVQAKLKEEANRINEIMLVPEAVCLKVTPLPNAIALVIPQSCIQMHQALFPCVYPNIEMKTCKTDIGMGDEGFSLLQSDEKFRMDMMQVIQEWMFEQGMKYFYYASVVRRTTNTLNSEYTVMVRGK